MFTELATRPPNFWSNDCGSSNKKEGAPCQGVKRALGASGAGDYPRMQGNHCFKWAPLL
jgi:hypothetical protein